MEIAAAMSFGLWNCIQSRSSRKAPMRDVSAARSFIGCVLYPYCLCGLVSLKGGRHCCLGIVARYLAIPHALFERGQGAARLLARSGPAAFVLQSKRTKNALWSKGAGWWRSTKKV